MKARYILLGVFVVLLIAISAFFFRDPSHVPELKEYLATPTTIEISDTTISFSNVRDWTYDTGGAVEKQYVDRVYDVNSLSEVYFVVEPFPDMPKFGHTFLVFTFTDAPPISFSVEALIEPDESYSWFAGLFHAYELGYTWGTERDFLSRRAVMLDHELYMYKLALTDEMKQAVFYAFAEGTVVLQREPIFYNTALHNCTNELVHLINDRHPGTLPWDWSRLFTGTADAYLFNLGYIEGESWEHARKNANITEQVELLGGDKDFSELLVRP